MEIINEKILEINGKKYWKRREFSTGSTYEAEMFWIPYFELTQGKVIQVSEDIPNRFYKTVKLIQDFDLCIDLKHNCYFTWRELTEENMYHFNKWGLKITEDDLKYKGKTNGNN